VTFALAKNGQVDLRQRIVSVQHNYRAWRSRVERAASKKYRQRAFEAQGVNDLFIRLPRPGHG